MRTRVTLFALFCWRPPSLLVEAGPGCPHATPNAAGLYCYDTPGAAVGGNCAGFSGANGFDLCKCDFSSEQDYFAQMTHDNCCLTCGCCTNGDPSPEAPPPSPPKWPPPPPSPTKPPPAAPANIEDWFDFLDVSWYIPSQGGNSIAVQIPEDVVDCYSESNVFAAMEWCMTVATEESQYPGTSGQAWGVSYYGTDGPTCGTDGPHGVACGNCTAGPWYCAMLGPMGTNDGTEATLGYTDCALIGWQINAGDTCVYSGYTYGHTWIRKPETAGMTYVPAETAPSAPVYDPKWVWSAEGQACTDRCAEETGLECDEDRALVAMAEQFGQTNYEAKAQLANDNGPLTPFTDCSGGIQAANGNFFPSYRSAINLCVYLLTGTTNSVFNCDATYSAGNRLCFCDQAPFSPPPPPPPAVPPVPNRYLESDACFVPLTYLNQHVDTVAWPLSSAIDSGTNDEYLAKISCIDSQQCTAITNVNTQLPSNNWMFITRTFDGSSAGTEQGGYGARTFVKIAHGQFSCIQPSMPPSPPAIPPPCIDTGVMTPLECDLGKQAGDCADPMSQTHTHCQYTCDYCPFKFEDTGEITSCEGNKNNGMCSCDLETGGITAIHCRGTCGCGPSPPPVSPPPEPPSAPPTCFDATSFSHCSVHYIDTGLCNTAEARQDCELSCGAPIPANAFEPSQAPLYSPATFLAT